MGTNIIIVIWETNIRIVIIINGVQMITTVATSINIIVIIAGCL